MVCIDVYIKSNPVSISRSHAAHPAPSTANFCVRSLHVRHEASASATLCVSLRPLHRGWPVRACVWVCCVHDVPRAEQTLIGRLYDHPAMAAPSALNLPSPLDPPVSPTLYAYIYNTTWSKDAPCSCVIRTPQLGCLASTDTRLLFLAV